MAHDPHGFDDDRSQRRIPIHHWKFRFDQPPTPADLLAGFDGDLVRLLGLRSDERFPTAEKMIEESRRRPFAPLERREVARHRPAEAKAMIGWWRGGDFVVFNALLLNLGEGGTRIEVEVAPTRSQPVWLCLGEPKLPDLAQARVLDALKTPKKSYQARLMFHLPCPSAFLEAAGKL